MLAVAQHDLRYGHIVLQVFLRQNGYARRHTAHHRHRRGGVAHEVGIANHLHGTGLHGVPMEQAALLQALKMPVHSGGGLQAHSIGDLPHGGRVALALNFGLDEVQDTLLIITTGTLHTIAAFAFNIDFIIA